MRAARFIMARRSGSLPPRPRWPPRRVSTAATCRRCGSCRSPASCCRSRSPRSPRRRSGITTSARRARSGRSHSSCRSRCTTVSTWRYAKSCTRCSPSTCRSSSCCLRCSRCRAEFTFGGNLHGSARLNTGILALGTVLASVMGTTGAAMLLIRPLLRANDNRRHRAHVVMFFIFLVANIGGALDTARRSAAVPRIPQGRRLLLDHEGDAVADAACERAAAGDVLRRRRVVLATRGRGARPRRAIPRRTGRFASTARSTSCSWSRSWPCVLLSGVWKPGLSHRHRRHDARTAGHRCATSSLLAIALGVLALDATSRAPCASLHVGSDRRGGQAVRRHLPHDHSGDRDAARGQRRRARAGRRARHGRRWPPNDALYFWVTGALSSFLDNAPTYLVFFNLAGGDAVALMGTMASTLTAISLGAVFMGANTYIGNAPNFMVKAIAEVARRAHAELFRVPRLGDAGADANLRSDNGPAVLARTQRMGCAGNTGRSAEELWLRTRRRRGILVPPNCSCASMLSSRHRLPPVHLATRHFERGRNLTRVALCTISRALR